MRNYDEETRLRVDYIRGLLDQTGAAGIVYGNSGGKDSALVGYLCRLACPDTLGLIMPCASQRNYGQDKSDAEVLGEWANVPSRVVDLTAARSALVEAAQASASLSDAALVNIAPRLRMTALYAVAASENRLVAGTGNRSERHMGYFTKWGDGACDFNPIADLTVGEVFAFLRHLKAPDFILQKAPSAGLFDGQTDESEMGISYARIDEFLLTGQASDADRALIDRFHAASEHKRQLPVMYENH